MRAWGPCFPQQQAAEPGVSCLGCVTPSPSCPDTRAGSSDDCHLVQKIPGERRAHAPRAEQAAQGEAEDQRSDCSWSSAVSSPPPKQTPEGPCGSACPPGGLPVSLPEPAAGGQKQSSPLKDWAGPGGEVRASARLVTFLRPPYLNLPDFHFAMYLATMFPLFVYYPSLPTLMSA